MDRTIQFSFVMSGYHSGLSSLNGLNGLNRKKLQDIIIIMYYCSLVEVCMPGDLDEK